MTRKLWHRLFGHGLEDLLAYPILLPSPHKFYWNVRCELCDKTVFRVGVPEEPEPKEPGGLPPHVDHILSVIEALQEGSGRA